MRPVGNTILVPSAVAERRSSLPGLALGKARVLGPQIPGVDALQAYDQLGQSLNISRRHFSVVPSSPLASLRRRRYRHAVRAQQAPAPLLGQFCRHPLPIASPSPVPRREVRGLRGGMGWRRAHAGHLLTRRCSPPCPREGLRDRGQALSRRRGPLFVFAQRPRTVAGRDDRARASSSR